MTSLYMYYALCFVLVEHSVGSNTKNAWEDGRVGLLP